MYRNLRRFFDPNSPPPLVSYRYQTHELCDENGTTGIEYTLYGPPGHEGNAIDWLSEHVIGVEALRRRHEPGCSIKFRYFEDPGDE